MGTRQGASALSVGVVALCYVLTQYYVYLHSRYDLSVLLVGAVVPLALSVVLPLYSRNRTLLFVFLAYYWSLVEDGPVFLDSVFTWPEVTSAPPHLLLEVLYHLLTAAFLVLAVREWMKGRPGSASKTVVIGLLIAAAFVLAYAQNIPLGPIQSVVLGQWYALDVAEHVFSALVLLLALGLSSR